MIFDTYEDQISRLEQALIETRRIKLMMLRDSPGWKVLSSNENEIQESLASLREEDMAIQKAA